MVEYYDSPSTLVVTGIRWGYVDSSWWVSPRCPLPSEESKPYARNRLPCAATPWGFGAHVSQWAEGVSWFPSETTAAPVFKRPHGCGSNFQPPGDRRFSIDQGEPFWAPIFDPQPHDFDNPQTMAQDLIEEMEQSGGMRGSCPKCGTLQVAQFC